MIKNVVIAVVSLMPIDGIAEPIAKVNGQPFSDHMFRQALDSMGRQGEVIKKNPEMREQFLDHVINNQLLAGEAAKKKMDQSESFKLKVEAARQEILAQIYLDEYLKDLTSEQNLRKYFEKNKNEFDTTRVKASHILFKEDNKEEAQEVLEKALESNADFAALAKMHSTGPSASKGGDLSFFSRGQMVPAFEEVAFSTPKNTVHPKLVKTKFGYHIIKVTNIRKGKIATFEKKRRHIARKLKREGRDKLVQELRSKANVSVDVEALKKVKI